MDFGFVYHVVICAHATQLMVIDIHCEYTSFLYLVSFLLENLVQTSTCVLDPETVLCAEFTLCFNSISTYCVDKNVCPDLDHLQKCSIGFLIETIARSIKMKFFKIQNIYNGCQ